MRPQRRLGTGRGGRGAKGAAREAVALVSSRLDSGSDAVVSFDYHSVSALESRVRRTALRLIVCLQAHECLQVLSMEPEVRPSRQQFSAIEHPTGLRGGLDEGGGSLFQADLGGNEMDTNARWRGSEFDAVAWVLF